VHSELGRLFDANEQNESVTLPRYVWVGIVGALMMAADHHPDGGCQKEIGKYCASILRQTNTRRLFNTVVQMVNDEQSVLDLLSDTES
jgi:hypothetical protein